MITLVEPKETTTLEDYGAHSHLASAVRDLRNEAAEVRRHINGRSILMVNSTSQGGGVAEMLPKMMGILKELGIKTRWAVMGSDDPAFFRLTKRLHNMIHGDGGGNCQFKDEDRRLFEYTGESNVDALRNILAPDDLLVIHDPQPLAMGAKLKKQLNLPAVWRCHIGLDEKHPSTEAAWEFLKPYIQVFDHNIFSADEYVPDYVRDRASIIYPAIDPLSYKNRTIRAEELTSILCNAGLGRLANPNLADPFPEPAQRLQPDGTFGPADSPDRIGFLYRPTITQISRWDRLKGWKPLLEGFIRIKEGLNGESNSGDERYRCRAEMLRLIMVGPDPASIQDDPEGCEVLNDLCATYTRLDPAIQKDVALLTLPMSSRKNNALMVNAIQTVSSIVVQNSIREGFGLTLTEAMWKGTPVVGSSACGLRQQIEDRIHGRVVRCPEDPAEVAQVLGDVISADGELNLWSCNARTRVQQEFLVFSQVKKWLRILKRFKTMSAPIDLYSDKVGAYSSVGHLDRTERVHYPSH
ncbi:MAG: glycosyltransferase [Acidobacteria bacterium]|nr:glycosyltransferase [Acidobacteriota bacterium]